MLTKINKIDADWVDVKNKCRTTVNKDYTPNVPSSKFKKDLLISEHSPIRLIHVGWSWKAIKSFVATHFSRHKWECFVSTGREDRTGVPDAVVTRESPVNFDGDANAQALIDTARKRLCYQASEGTRHLMEDLKLTLRQAEPELADVLVPNCVYRGFCPEFKSCGLWHVLTRNMCKDDVINWETRYARYNTWLAENREVEND